MQKHINRISKERLLNVLELEASEKLAKFVYVKEGRKNKIGRRKFLNEMICPKVTKQTYDISN